MQTFQNEYSNNINSILKTINVLNKIAQDQLDFIDDGDEIAIAHLQKQQYILTIAQQLEVIVREQNELLMCTIQK